jgi:hypothetical protein
MTADEMSQKILEYIGRNGDASFANLMDMFGEDAKGELALEVLPNEYLWANMSRTLIAAIAAIKPLLEVNVTSVLVYFADGHSLTLPIATRIPKGGFRKPHWVPVVLKRKQGAGARDTSRK